MVVDCPRCHCPTMLVDSAVIYGRSYGPIYLCIICGAYVGCHPGSTRPPGDAGGPGHPYGAAYGAPGL